MAYQRGLIPSGRPPSCGATLITTHFALTAAHCVTRGISRDLYDRVLVGGGSITWNRFLYPAPTDPQYLVIPTINNVFIHEHYNAIPMYSAVDGNGEFVFHRNDKITEPTFVIYYFMLMYCKYIFRFA